MKVFCLVIISTLLISCGKSGDTSSPVANSTASEVQRDIVFQASRGYNPSSWSDYTEIVVMNSYAKMPIELQATVGNAGTGWASIVVGSKKFCYQGNASNNNTANGTKFVIVKEKTDITVECHQSNNDKVYDLDISLTENEVIKVSVHGGGCSNSQGTCLNTTVTGSIDITE